MAQEVVKALMLEIDGNLEKLRRELRKGEGDLTGFATKAKTVGKDVGAGADAMTNKFGAAARGAASAMETIARTGKASGEAMKQLVAQGSQAAVFFGPGGALVGAIGISVVAILGMFSRTREEIVALERQTAETMNRFAEMDAAGQRRAIVRLEVGDPFKQDLGTIFSTSDNAARREAIRGRGRLTIGEDIARLRAEREAAAVPRMVMSQSASGTSFGPDAVRIAELTQQINELAGAYDQMGRERDKMLPLQQAAVQQEAALKAVTEASTKATKGATAADEERKRAREELNRESERLAETTARLISGTLGTSVERVAKQYDALIEEHKKLAALGVDPAGNMLRADELEDAKRAAVGAAQALEQAAAAMHEIDRAQAQGIAPAWLSIDRLGDSAKVLKQELLALVPGTEDYVKVREKLLQVEKKIHELSKSNDPDAPKPPDPKSDARDMADYARAVQQAADGALQLAQNLGGANDSLIGMTRSMIQIAGNLPALSKAWTAMKDQKPGESGIGLRLGVLGAALPILGALSSMFGKSPEEQQRAQEIRENTEAIREWTTKVGALGGVDLSGSDATGAAGGLRPFLRRFAGNGLLPARSAAQAAGLDLAALDRIAASLGITLNDNIQSFEQLAKQLNATTDKLGEFGDDLDSQRRQAEAEIALFGVTDPLERLRIRQRATGGRSSALDGVTAGLDLSTAEGREQARRNAQALFDVMRAGGGTLGAGALGGLTGDELLQALLDLIDGLRDVEGAVSTAGGGSVVGGVSGYSGLTAAAGARLEDYNRAMVTYARDAQVTRLDMLARLDQLAQHLVGPIPVPPMGALGGARSGGVQIQIGPGAFVLQFSISGGARDDVLSAIGDGIERVTTDALYRGILQARIVAGDLRVAS